MVNNTEKNEQEQTIHYPFSGFYRKLLPAEGTATTAEQTTQAAPIPTPADDTPQNATGTTESAHRRVTDVIGEDYKTWSKGHYAIDAGTGTGKTTFVLEQLLPWVRMRRKAGGKKILYLCNRTSLEGEIIERIKACGENATYYEEDPGSVYFDNISVFCYQWLEHVLINDSARIERIMKGCDYVVADECHYFYSDSGFNPNTDISYLYLEKVSTEKPVIYMSATANRMIEAWKNMGRIDDNHIFSVPKDYSYIKSGMLYNGKTLPGAKFKLQKYNTTTSAYEDVDGVTYTTDESGRITIQRQKNDTDVKYEYNVLYRVVETDPPEGYLMPANPEANAFYFYFSSTDDTTNTLPTDRPADAADLADPRLSMSKTKAAPPS